MYEINHNTFLQNAVLYGKMLLHRYLRLTPVFIMSILVTEIASALLVDVSVYEIFFRDDFVCPKSVFYFLKNIFFYHILTFLGIGGEICYTFIICIQKKRSVLTGHGHLVAICSSSHLLQCYCLSMLSKWYKCN